MDQEKTQRQLLDLLVQSQHLTKEQADDVYYAPRFSFSIRELVTYLAGLIIGVGVIRVISVAFEDASQMSISLALYATSALVGALSWRFSTRSEILQRFGEVLELGSLGSFAAATGLALNEADMKGEWIGIILSALAIAWGLYRMKPTRFAGTVAFVVGTPVFTTCIAALIDSDNPRWGGFFTLIASAVLITAGTQRIHAAYIARAVGAVTAITGSMMLANEIANAEPLPIVTGAVLFAIGSILLAPELLLAGAFCVIAGVVMSVSEWVANDMAQGFVIIGTGLAVLAVLSVQMRRAMNGKVPNQPTPGAQVA